MKILLFKILLLYRTKDQGFTLPMVIGIGLIMVLLSSVSLLQASEENLIAISKTQSSASLAMAELGVARYRELLNNNRVLAVHNLNDPDPNVEDWTHPEIATQTCNSITNTIGDDGWAYNNWVNNPGADPGWRPVELDETALVPPMDLNNDGDAIDTDAVIGSYRIVDYVYQIDTNDPTEQDNGVFDQTDDEENRADSADPNTGPRGILTVQGQALGSDSVAQIQVTIPIGVNIDDLDTLNPGIWVRQENIINMGDLNFNLGNLVLESDANGCDNINVAGAIAIRDPRDLPPLVTLPNPPIGVPNRINALTGDLQNINGAPRFDPVENEIILGTLADIQNSDEDLNGDNKIEDQVDYIGDDRYYYEVNGNLTINDGQSLITDGTARVIVRVDGDLNINGNVNIVNSSDAATSRFLEIHVTGNVNIGGDDNVNITALIHAPNGTVNIAGNAVVNLTGSIWADDWDSVGIVNVTTSEYEHYSVTSERTPKPLTFAPTGWEQQEATN